LKLTPGARAASKLHTALLLLLAAGCTAAPPGCTLHCCSSWLLAALLLLLAAGCTAPPPGCTLHCSSSWLHTALLLLLAAGCTAAPPAAAAAAACPSFISTLPGNFLIRYPGAVGPPRRIQAGHWKWTSPIAPRKSGPSGARRFPGVQSCSPPCAWTWACLFVYLFISSKLSRSSAPALHCSPRSPTRADPPGVSAGVLASLGVTAPGRLAPVPSPSLKLPMLLIISYVYMAIAAASRAQGSW
jgi:hypothetical protein